MEDEPHIFIRSMPISDIGLSRTIVTNINFLCALTRSLGGRKISTCTYVHSNIKNIADEGRLSDTTLYEHQSCISGTNEHPHFSDDNDPKSVPPGD